MKKMFLLTSLVLTGGIIVAQKYPDPEFSNEVYYLKKDSVYSVIRLEKNRSKMESKTKMGGFGGAESGYEIEGEKSPVRFSNGNNLSFVFSDGSSSGSSSSSPQRDSMMRANGMDPSMMQGMGSMRDPGNMITLYKAETGKNNRKILLQKSPSALPFSNKKARSGDKFTFSLKKIRNGYWELVIDKPLAKGEYAFTMMDMSSMSSMDGGVMVFAFAID